MSNQVWILIAVVVIVTIVIAYQRSRQSQVRQTRDLRMGAQELGRAQSPGEEISQREDHRLAGMSAEDRDWEQASLQRNRDIQDERTRQSRGQKTCPRRPSMPPRAGGEGLLALRERDASSARRPGDPAPGLRAERS